MRILIVDGDAPTAGYLRKSLQEHGFVVDLAGDGVSGGQCASGRDYSLVIVNLQLAGIDGDRLLATLRQRDADCALLAMTATDRVEDKVRALSSGADDVIAKPVAFAELLARMHALLRRSAPGERPAGDLLRLADLEVDRASQRVRRAGRYLALTLQEYSLLCLLLERRGAVLSREYLTDQIWDTAFDGSSKVVDVAISRLRAKLDDAHAIKLLHTVRGIGYRLDAECVTCQQDGVPAYGPGPRKPTAPQWHG